MKSLYESILRPEIDVKHAVEIVSILRKHGWYVKDAYWKGGTLCIVFDGRGYMDDFDEVAEELQCKNFNIYPWAIITSKKPLDGFTIEAATRLDITAPELKGCRLSSTQGTTITASKGIQKVKVINCDLLSKSLCFNNTDGMTLTGNNFNDVEILTLKHVGPRIEKIVLGWNLVTNNKGRWTTYPRPSGEPDPNMDPFKDLGLNKHFKNLTDLNITLGTGGNDCYISFSTSYKRGRYDWGVMNQVDLTNGFQCNVIKGAIL